jgi:hypothetical protein
MLMESFVAIMAMISASIIHPGRLFCYEQLGRADRHHSEAGRAGHLGPPQKRKGTRLPTMIGVEKPDPIC